MDTHLMDIEEISQPQAPDFKRANGSPMVVVDGKRERYSRSSSYAKPLDDESALQNWKIDVALKGVAHDPALQARIAAVKDDDRTGKSTLREAAIQAGRGAQAADIGTAIHAMTCRWEDPDDDFQPPEEFAAKLRAYSAEMERLGLVSERFEFQVVTVEYRAAGTCDRLYRLTRDLVPPDGRVLPAGTLIIGDIKTNKKMDYGVPGYAAQLSLYAQGQWYNVETDEFMPTPDVNKDWGILMHIPSSEADVCEALWVDLQVGNYGCYLASEIKDWRKKWRSGEYAAPVVEVQAPQHDDLPPGRAYDDWGNVGFDPTWVPTMLPFIKQRMKVLRDHPEALKQLTLKWPEDCPPPKSITTVEQTTQVLDLLDEIEATFGLPWPENDPRATPGVHASELNTTNSPRSGEKARSR